MSQVFPVLKAVAERAWTDEAGYFRLYEQSLKDPDGFWGEQAKRIDWIKPFTKVKNTSFTGDVSISWFEDGTLNASLQLRRPASRRPAPTRPRSCGKATSPSEQRHVSYAELHDSVCRLANVLKAHGVKKGDRVTIYLPMIPEAAFAMLACARIGAVHSRRVRRLLAREPGRPHPGLRLDLSSSPPTRACAAAARCR